MLPFFSIITPVYNCEKYIRECIESVINQTYAFWEMILIDDGSTDGSGKICDDFSSDSRIKVIHQENAGAFISRINGITAANGVYEIGLDADDYLDKNCLETLKKVIDRSDSDLIFFGFRTVGDREEEIKCTLKPGKEYSQKEILGNVIEQTNHSLCNKAIKLCKVREADYSDIKKDLSINLDYAQIIPILCRIDSGYVIDDVLYNYRICKGSISHSCKVVHIFDTGLVTEYVVNRLKDERLLDNDLCNKIYLAYLKMIGFRLFQLFCMEKISRRDCINIHKSKVYIHSEKMELQENLGRKEFEILRLFRRRQYWKIRQMAKNGRSE